MSFNDNSFTWNFDHFKLDAFKTAQNNVLFSSDLFQIHETQWQLECYPNGFGNDNEGDVSIHLRCKTLPDWTKQLEVDFAISINDTDFIKRMKHNFAANERNGFPKIITNNTLETVKSFQIKCTIQLSDLQKQISLLKQQLMSKTIEIESLKKQLGENDIEHKSENELSDEKLDGRKAEGIHIINAITGKNAIKLIDNIQDVNKGIDFKKY
eukprot:239111_1